MPFRVMTDRTFLVLFWGEISRNLPKGFKLKMCWMERSKIKMLIMHAWAWRCVELCEWQAVKFCWISRLQIPCDQVFIANYKAKISWYVVSSTKWTILKAIWLCALKAQYFLKHSGDYCTGWPVLLPWECWW